MCKLCGIGIIQPGHASASASGQAAGGQAAPVPVGGFTGLPLRSVGGGREARARKALLAPIVIQMPLVSGSPYTATPAAAPGDSSPTATATATATASSGTDAGAAETVAAATREALLHDPEVRGARAAALATGVCRRFMSFCNRSS